MRTRVTVALAVVLALVAACAAFAADRQRVRVIGARTAVVTVPWRATLEVRPAPRAAPRVTVQLGRTTATAQVRRRAAGKYAVTASFPRAGRWRVSARLGSRRYPLGTVVVSAAPIRLLSVLGIALHPDGGLLIADGDAGRVLRADVGSGRLSIFASAGLVAPTGLAVARDGTVYIADRTGRSVFRVVNGTVRRVAEYGEPLHAAVDSRGALFVTGRENTVVRVDPATGATTRYAGTGEAGSSGDGGHALGARLATPHGITVDPADNVVIGEDAGVRRIDRTTNVIDRVAGTGISPAHCGEQGPPRQMCMSAIRVAFERDGDFYVADPFNARLWRVARGQASAFNVGFPPLDVIVESERTLLLADNVNRRVVRYDIETRELVRVVG